MEGSDRNCDGTNGKYNKGDARVTQYQTRPSFVYFHPFLNTTANLIQNLTITGKSIDCVFGFRAQDCMILGSDESTDLWRPPSVNVLMIIMIATLRL